MSSPYRWMFPAGVVHGILGALAWVFFALGWVDYPGAMHADAMVIGFLFSFAAGFLMTAVPRFTGTRPARRVETAAAFILSMSLVATYAVPAPRALVHGIAFCQLGLLGAFFRSRYARRTREIPKPFVFVAVGIAAGLAGAILLLLTDLGWAPGGFAPGGRALLYHDAMVLLAAGVGSHLLPTFFGSKGGARGCAEIAAAAGAPAAILLVTTAVLDLAGALQAASWTRAGGVTWIAFRAWGLWRFPASPSRLAAFLWISAWCLVAGLWFRAAAPVAAVHVMHVAFVSGLGLLTLMIASRVTLAHGGFDSAIERTSKTLLVAGVLTVLAALTRVVAPWTGASYVNHLAFAAVCWLAGLTVWALAFVPKMTSSRRTPR